MLDPPSHRRSVESEVQQVGVLGGGSAGYLAALALKRLLPGLSVTLIESSSIPVIGVGEATTPLLAGFLHGKLGLDIFEFYRRVRPTWKYGVRFEWGRPEEGYYFNYPFDKGPLLESHLYDGNINNASIESLMMTQGKSNLVDLGGGEHELWRAPFAYHLENARFIAYLREEAEKAGVVRLDRRVLGAELRELGAETEVDALLTDGGERLSFDLYLDCSGFASLLLGEELRSPFESFASSLLNDTAIAANLPAERLPRPYTTARTMENGWAWEIPLIDGTHIGYVFSSEHVAVDEARREMQEIYPAMRDARVIGFRSGRRREAWKGNVIAIGNSCAFLEPLESTALHMACLQLTMLVDYFPARKHEVRNRAQVNRAIAGAWDELRGFMALHFKHNGRSSTPYWQDCRRHTDLSGAEEVLACYQERGPLSYRHHLVTRFYDDYGFDVILLGQDVISQHLVGPRWSCGQWEGAKNRALRLVARALPIDRGYEILSRRPELLRRLAEEAGWLRSHAVLEGYPSGRYD